MIVSRRAGLPTTAARELAPAARRTRRVRLLLAAAAIALLALALALARSANARPTSYFATGGGGIVVLDLSTSVDRLKYERIQRVLRSLADTGTHVGLIVFSDTAYEMLPPGTRGTELRPLLRFFVPLGRAEREREQRTVRRTFGIQTPWSSTFRGGTRISTGLREARFVIRRDRISEPSVLLVSDLDDSGLDRHRLTQELIRYGQEGIKLRVVPLFPVPEDVALFTQMLGRQALLARPEVVANSAVRERQTLVGSFPVAFVCAGAALLALLALNERVCGRLTWRRAA